MAVPDWMLSPQICDQFTNEDGPRVSIDALFDLRRLIERASSWKLQGPWLCRISIRR